MKINKIINNNIVTSKDDEGREIIVMGRGLGFGKKPGMTLDESHIDKIFRLKMESANQKLLEIIKDIPLTHIQAAGKIIDIAQKKLGDQLKDTIYLSLVDHINCAIERYRNNIIYSNALLWEISQYYPDEYQIGLESLKILKEIVGIEFPTDEAGFIAFHFITAEYDTKMSITPDIPRVLHEILDIIEEFFPGQMKQDSLHFQRFMTHLKFFIARLLESEQLKEEDDTLFHSMIRKKYENCYLCAMEIRKRIEEEYFTLISEEEVIYLTVHIKRITETED